MHKQILSCSYDKDTGIADLRLLTGEHYYVTNAGHALAIRERLSPGGSLNMKQLNWLERYRVPAIGSDDRKKVAARIAEIRKEVCGGPVERG